MKNINIIFAALAISVLAAGCSKESLSKSEVEAGFTNSYKGEIPEVSFSATPTGDAKFDVKTSAIYVETKVTVSGISEELGSVVIGVISSSKADLSNPKSTSLEVSQDGTYDLRALVNANSTCYLQASVSTPYGCTYSDAVKVSVSDVPFYSKIAGSWKGTISSLVYGDEYKNTIKIILDEDDPENVCYVCNLEPYYSNEGYVQEEGFNIIEAAIDNENNQIIIATGSSMTLAGRSFYASDEEGEVIEYGALVLSEDGEQLTCNEAFYTVKSDGKAEDWYGPAVYTKQ
ncbi:MAG: hypothetical protein ACI4TL_01330 [Candidatus Cryptobacteroides sp.]